MRTRLESRALLLLVALGCGGDGSSGNVKGTVLGNALNVRESVFYRLPDNHSFPAGSVEVVLADQPGVCDAVRASHYLKSATALQLTLAHFSAADAGALGIDVGTYTVVGAMQTPGGFAQVSFGKDDGMCMSTLSATVTQSSGTITLTNIDQKPGGFLDGTFALTQGTENQDAGIDAISGSFHAAWCDAVPQPLATTCP